MNKKENKLYISYFEFIYLFSNSIYINIDLESKSRKI